MKLQAALNAPFHRSPFTLLPFLLLLLFVNSSTGIESNNVLRLHSMDDDDVDHHHHDHHHHGHHHVGDPSLMVFFTLDELKKGNRMEIYFSKKAPGSSPKLLPREEAESIPFSLNQLPFLLNHFSFSPGSPQARAMEDTLTQCHVIRPIKGETKFCATSPESLNAFARSIFGRDPFRVLKTKYDDVSSSTTTTSALLQNYTVSAEPIEIPAQKMVACHVMPYPYGVFYCHSQDSQSRVFRVSLVGDDRGGDVDAVAVCHMDTSQWSRSHVSFSVLGTQPGASHVCHFFPAENLVMVPG